MSELFTHSAKEAAVINLIEKVGRIAEIVERMEARMTEAEAKLIRLERHLEDLFGTINSNQIQP